MTEPFFLVQIDRLKNRFGPKAFDKEIVKLMGREVYMLSEQFFLRTVDTWIGSRKQSQPPLLTDFREARLAYEKLSFQKDVKGAANTWSTGLREVLKKEYKVDSVKEAFELALLNLKLGKK